MNIQSYVQKESTLIQVIILLSLVALLVLITSMAFVPLEYTILGFALLIGAPVGLLMVLRPQLILIATIAIFPIERAEFLDVLPITTAKLLGGLLIAAILFNIVFRKQKFRFFDDALDYFVCFFNVALLISSLTSNHVDTIFGDFDRILRLTIFYFAVKNLVDSPRMVYILLVAFFAMSVYASAYSIYEANTVTTEWGKAVRAAGVNESPNNFALKAVLALGIGYYLVQLKQDIRLKILFGIGVLTICIAIIMSGSRGGLISMSFISLLMILRHPKRIQLLIVIAIVFVSSIQFWPENVRSRYFGLGGDFQTSSEEGAEQSTARRTSYVIYGLELISEKPLIGSGYRSFSQLYPASDYAFFDNPLEERERYRVAHNVYIETMVGTGLIGLAALIGMMFSAWYALFRTYTAFPKNSLYWASAHGLELALIGFAISSLFLTSEQFKQFWFLLGMSSALLFQLRSLQVKQLLSESIKTVKQSYLPASTG